MKIKKIIIFMLYFLGFFLMLPFMLFFTIYFKLTGTSWNEVLEWDK